jgi:enoyl-CoA hydratase/carnithine racemase
MSLRIQSPAEGVRCLLLDRPDVRNAIDLDLVDALAAAVAEVALEATGSSSAGRTRAVVIGSATPGMFCAGADLAIPDAERAQVSDRLYALYEALIALPVPVIAAVDGAAVGGGAQLVLAADVRYGSDRARLKFVGPGHGLAVGLWALPSVMGRGRALEAVLTQRFIGAEEAVASGLLDRLVADPPAEAMRVAEATGKLDPDAVARAKRLVVDGERLVDRLAAERAGNVAVFTGAVARPASGRRDVGRP